MKNRFKDIIDNVEYEDLLKIDYDLDNGGTHLSRLIKKIIKDKQNEHDNKCSICSNDIDNFSVNTISNHYY